ncbi:hypothetical protein [Rubrivirga litoralis]|uniref:Ig-like domain-containing protein n=1 Tax=Rubrivirga litoralis TaxID=3075598 RepID=A0ABU3BLY3_9BACT|nr:hypothetical protein [Rubrivirga sp. F394]MDT0630299.1 hypothetical protein [Rubrivirga sp. F394]
MSLRPALSSALLGLALLAGSASAQPMQTAAPPAHGALAPAPGEAARVAFDVRARVDNEVPGCTGVVDPSAPDAVVDWGGGDFSVWTRAAFDATLLVAQPDGSWTCNDDAEGLMPVVTVGGAAAGRYAVWVGSYASDPDEPAVALYAGAAPALALDATAPPAAGDVDAAAGFEADRGSIEIAVQAGGADWIGSLGSECRGFVDAARPTARVRYTAAEAAPLVVAASTPGDDVLAVLVQTPDGTVLCSDGGYALALPVVVDDAAAGDYAVWLGTTNGDPEPVDARLVLSETVPESVLDERARNLPYSEGTYTVLDLDARPAPLVLGAEPVEAAYLIQPTSPNPVSGRACTGYLDVAPTTALRFDVEGPVTVAATAASDADLALTVRTPGGTWLCSDDSQGLDPAVQFDETEPGDYLTWVGTFGPATAPVAVAVAATPGALAVEDDPASAVESTPQSPGSYAGDAIRPGGAAVVVSALETEAAVLAGGPVSNPVDGDVCRGFLSERPAAEVQGSGPLTISATAGTDLTLVVRTADGAWTCSDDADGTDPSVTVDAAGGAASVWVGTFSRLPAPTPARLRVERGGE